MPFIPYKKSQPMLELAFYFYGQYFLNISIEYFFQEHLRHFHSDEQ